jgi:hypothetical protein
MYIYLLCFIAMLKIICYQEEAVRDLQNVRRECEKSKSEFSAISKAHQEKLKEEEEISKR